MSRELSDRLSGRVEPRRASGQVGGGESVTNPNDTVALGNPLPLHRGRITVGRLAEIAEQLDERDLAIVATLNRVRMATGSQLQRLHFARVPSADRQARRVLGRLVDLEILGRLARSVGGRRAGSTGFIYSLGVAGQRLAGGRGPAGGPRIERPWTPSAPYLKHLLTVSELYVELQALAAIGEAELLAFEAEPACWRSFLGAGGERIALKPDAFVRLGVGEFERLHFVEVDLATESPRTLDGKLARYRSYAASGIEEGRWGVHPFVTWLVPDERRAQVVADACSRMPEELWPLFLVATLDEATDTLLGVRS